MTSSVQAAEEHHGQTEGFCQTLSVVEAGNCVTECSQVAVFP